MTVTTKPTLDLNDGHRKVFSLKPNIQLQEEASASVEESKAMAKMLIDALSIASKEKVDFTHNETLRKIIDKLFDENPRVFGYEKTYSWETQEEKDSLIAALKTYYGLEEITSRSSDDSELKPTEQPISHPAFAPQACTLAKAKPSSEKKHDNLGLAFIEMQMHVHEVTEGRIHALINKLSLLNAINKDLSDFINILTGCKESGKADFSKDPEISALIDRLHEVNPKIFGKEKAYAWNSEKQIDLLLSALDAEVKTKIAEVNQATMFINVRFDERVQFSENSRKVLEMLIRHVESIISKYHKT